MKNSKATYQDIVSMIDVARDLLRAPKPTPGLFVNHATAEGAKQKVVEQIMSLGLPSDKQQKALVLLRENKFASLTAYLKTLTQ